MGVPAPGATGGGPALHLPMLVEDLRARGIAVQTFSFGRWAEGEPPALKVWHQVADLLRFPALLLRARPDLVHLNSACDRRALLRDVPFSLVCRMFSVPVYVKWHGSETDLLATHSPFWAWFVRRLFRTVAGIAVLSSEEAAAVHGHPQAPRCDVVRNGLDLQRYEGRPPVKPRLGVHDSASLLLFIGRLIPAKGLLEVVRALPAVVARHDVHLVIVGDGPTREPALAIAAELGLGPRVHATGRIPEAEAADYYCGCDVLVFPTYHAEGFPMTVFQSLAGGLGIVTTRLRATADYLQDPENCRFVAPRDIEALSRALDQLLSDRAELARMRRANRDCARRFDRRIVAAEFAAIYAEVITARPRRRSLEDR
jgi:glycosyltransferase involved in cell wall biosynthesis